MLSFVKSSMFISNFSMDRSGCLKQRASNEIMQFPTSFPGTYMSIAEQCRRFTGGPPCEVTETVSVNKNRV